MGQKGEERGRELLPFKPAVDRGLQQNLSHLLTPCGHPVVVLGPGIGLGC